MKVAGVVSFGPMQGSPALTLVVVLRQCRHHLQIYSVSISEYCNKALLFGRREEAEETASSLLPVRIESRVESSVVTDDVASINPKLSEFGSSLVDDVEKKKIPITP